MCLSCFILTIFQWCEGKAEGKVEGKIIGMVLTHASYGRSVEEIAELLNLSHVEVSSILEEN